MNKTIDFTKQGQNSENAAVRVMPLVTSINIATFSSSDK